MTSLTLNSCEMLALRAGVLSLAPNFELDERIKADVSYDKSIKSLLKTINERDDTPLGRVHVQNKLKDKMKSFEHYNDMVLAVKSVIQQRRLLISKNYDGISLLVQAIHTAVNYEASRYNFSERYNSIISISAYCCLIIHGPEGFELPTPAPDGVLRPLARVPRFADVAASESVH